jgi:hypothetical protein
MPILGNKKNNYYLKKTKNIILNKFNVDKVPDTDESGHKPKSTGMQMAVKT